MLFVAIHHFCITKISRLKLFCRPWSPMDPTGIWPPLPIVVLIPEAYPPDSSFDQAFDAVTMHRNRVREIHLCNIRSSQTEGLASTMRGRFPALIHFTLTCDFEEYPSLRDGILDGIAPPSTNSNVARLPIHCTSEPSVVRN